jgi:PAS domain S-box-containing protein
MNANDELYRRIVNAVPEGIWIVSPEGRTIFCNERMAELLGADVESLQKLSCFDPVFPDDVEEAQRQFGLQMSGGGQPFDFRLRRMDGSAIWVSISCKPVLDGGGTCTGLLGLFTDISERRRAESDLQDSEKLFRAIFSQAAVGIAQTSLTGDWLLVNDRLREILGYTQAELRTKTFLDVTHPDDRDASLDAIRQLLSGELSSWLTEKRYIRKSGTVVWGRLFVSLVRDQSNKPQYFIAVVEEVTDRIQAERALQESQQQLRLALSTGLGVWDCDLRAGAVGLSPQYRSVFGYSPLSYGEWMKLIHPDDRKRVVAVAKEGVERTHEWEAEFRVLWPDGTVRWMLSKGKVILDEGRRPARMVGISLDVTERKLAEEQRLRLAAIVESSDAAIVGETVDGTIVSWNQGAEKLYGYKAEEVVGRHISMLVPAERQDRIEPLFERLRRGERIEQFETIRVRKDNQLVPVSLTVSPIIDPSGAVVGISAIGRDITEQKQAEAKLRESEERFRNMADSAPVALWVTDPDGKTSFYNKSALRFTGLTMEHLSGSNWTDLVHPDDRAACQSTYSSALVDRRSFRIECRLLRADGEYRWVLCNGVPRFSSDGAFAGHLGTSVDITQVRRLQEEAIARQKLESLGALAGGIAHDFNNVLGGILAEAELAEGDLPADSVPREEIQKIKAATIHGAEIVRELMIYAGQDKAHPMEPVDVSRLVENMLQLLKVSITKHAILVTELAENLPAVLGSAPQIRQVVMNLVINASEAIGEKEGVITVTTDWVSGTLTPDTSTRLPQGDHVVLEVSDTGAGIKEEIKAKIFDPFFSTKFPGRGMGLAVVQRIVRDHGGTINLMSVLGHGTKFQVFLPCTAKRASETPIAISSTNPKIADVRTRTILVVEDEHLLRVAISKSLRKVGFLVMEASDGSTARDLIRAHKDDLDAVLLDVTLPGTSSWEVLQEARSVRPDLKVVVTSAYSKETVDASFSGLRVHHFIRKPFHLDDMARLLMDSAHPQTSRSSKS